MRRISLATIVLAGILGGLVSPAWAQQAQNYSDDPANSTSNSNSGTKTFGERLRSLFMPDPPPQAPTSRPADATQSTPTTWNGQNTQPIQGQQYPQGQPYTQGQQQYTQGQPYNQPYQTTPSQPAPAGRAESPGTSRGIETDSSSRQRIAGGLSNGFVPASRSTDGTDAASGVALGGQTGTPTSAASNASTTNASGSEGLPPTRKVTEIVPSAANSGGPGAVPLYERMSAFRQSPFDTKPAADAAKPADAATSAAPAKAQPASPARSAANLSSGELSAENAPLIAPPRTSAAPTVPGSMAAVTPSPAIASRAAISPAAVPALGAPARQSPPVAAAPTATAAPMATAATTATAAPAVDRSAENFAPSALMSHQSPILSVETFGPRKMIVGKEAAYELALRNTGSVAADELLVLVDLPAWAEVQRVEASVGTAQSVAGAGPQRQLQWKIGRLEAKGQQRLTLKIVPRENRPLDLAVRWDYKQTASQVVIEVQEPKLAIHVEGPREVLYGKKELYKIKVSNSGSGDAENVVIRLLPLGTGDNGVATHNFGTIAAGEEKAIEVELTARQSGLLTMKVEALAASGARAEAAEPVLVRRAALTLHVEAPKLQYVGSTAVYRMRISNPGNAPANNLVLTAGIPAGMKLLSSSEGGQPKDDGAAVSWKLDSLGATVEKVFEIKCAFKQEGPSRLNIAATAEDDLSVATDAVTRVEAIANLAMEVTNPTGPIPVGEETQYEVRVSNRGTKSAEQIEIAALFSQGIEPTAAEGGPHKLAPGQVTFDTVPSLAAGQELRLKITAKAQAAGSHIFRAEVRCLPLATRLVREETTYFYAAQGAATEEAPAGPKAPAPAGVRQASPPEMGMLPGRGSSPLFPPR
jgi:uncharacterized repeat protein (TIGR01451 family)